MELRDYQLNAVDGLRQGIRDGHKAQVLCSPTGCLTGDTKLVINRGGCARVYSLATIVSRLNGESTRGANGRVCSWDLNIPTYTQSVCDDGIVRLNEIVGVHRNGERPVFRVVLEDGRTIRATDAHQFMREDGSWARLSSLAVGDRAMVAEWSRTMSAQVPRTNFYALVSHMDSHPFGQVTNSKRDGKIVRVPLHRLVAEARQNGISLAELVGRIHLGYVDDLEFLDPREFHVHHIDENIRNNAAENLEVLPVIEHLRLHGTRSGYKHVSGKATAKAISDISPCGEEEVFDLTMAAPMHNYVANEFVVHNSGKTVIATHLMGEAKAKGSRAIFCCDRIAILDQTSRTFDAYGIDHGVLQGAHWRHRPWERIQVASAQTLARRGIPEGTNLLIVDECHTIYESVKGLMATEGLITVGLSATPFTKGLGKLFSNVVNVTTTDKLIAEGWLTPLKVYAARAADMKGARLKFDGEWAEDEMESRGLTIVGDIVSEWVKQTTAHFGGPAKTLVFSATVRHGEEICRQFQTLGFNFQQISYLDGNDDSRRALIEEFRKPDSEIVGLVSVEALAKGFDVVDVRVGVSARPYRKSLSSHIQQIGRLMRPAEGKEFALLLDHAGNYLRFRDDMERVFAEGVISLDDGDLDSKVRKEPEEEEKQQSVCGACHYVMAARASHCPACGWERPKRRVEVVERPGELVEVGKKATPDYLKDKESVWRQLCGLGLERKKGDIEAAERFAKANYRNIYNAWPRHAMRNITPEPPSPEIQRKVQSLLIAYFKRQAA